ncbi:MAG: aldo/keto reductase [Nitrospinota bacterium]|nr:MAG: aldo/keto reductase [Nitrospinota bacterium]
MQMKTLGKTGLTVSRLGAGLSEIGYRLTFDDEAEAAAVLNAALDGGINFLDTSACYGISEELIGRTIAHRRQEYILATKCGHVAGGYVGEPWTAQTITDSIDRSLTRMKTDYLDLVQLHSCDVDVLERGEAIQALQDAQKAGKTRFIGYSGDNEAARWAVESGLFDTLQTSFNLVDQRARTTLFPLAKARNMGIIVKRPIANGAWGAPQSPSAYADEYFARAQTMLKMGPIPGAPENRILLALGFVLSHDEVDTAIVGTRNPAHMRANLEWMSAEQWRLAPEVIDELYRRFAQVGADWVQLI